MKSLLSLTSDTDYSLAYMTLSVYEVEETEVSGMCCNVRIAFLEIVVIVSPVEAGDLNISNLLNRIFPVRKSRAFAVIECRSPPYFHRLPRQFI